MALLRLRAALLGPARLRGGGEEPGTGLGGEGSGRVGAAEADRGLRMLVGLLGAGSGPRPAVVRRPRRPVGVRL